MVAFIDGRVTKPDKTDQLRLHEEETAFGDAWKEKDDTGAHYREPTTAPHAARMDATTSSSSRPPTRARRTSAAGRRRRAAAARTAAGKTRAGVGVVA